jgi:hypothetical protein
MGLTTWHQPWRSASGDHVAAIVPVRPDDQMRGVATRGIVAAVTDEQSIGNPLTVRQLPRDSVNRFTLAVLRVVAISGSTPMPGPGPALVRTSSPNPSPESFGLLLFALPSGSSARPSAKPTCRCRRTLHHKFATAFVAAQSQPTSRIATGKAAETLPIRQRGMATEFTPTCFADDGNLPGRRVQPSVRSARACTRRANAAKARSAAVPAVTLARRHLEGCLTSSAGQRNPFALRPPCSGSDHTMTYYLQKAGERYA